MARDPKLWKRNSLVVPGGLLTLYAVAGLLYVAAYRQDGSCHDSYRFLVGGLCYSAYPFLLAILILGLVLVTVGLVVFRSRPAELPGHLHSGTPTHFVLALLASLVVVPALVWFVLYYVEKSQDLRPFMTMAGGYPFQTKFLFLLVSLGAFLALVPFVGLFLAHGRLRRTFLRQVEEVALEDEAPFPGEPAVVARNPLDAPPPEEFVDESLWPASRAEEASAASPRPGTPPGAMAWAPPAPAPKANPSGALSVSLPPLPSAQAPVVAVAAGCRAILPSGAECSKSVGPGGRYCLSHACQGRTASGAPCKNAAAEGTPRCPAHSLA